MICFNKLLLSLLCLESPISTNTQRVPFNTSAVQGYHIAANEENVGWLLANVSLPWASQSLSTTLRAKDARRAMTPIILCGRIVGLRARCVRGFLDGSITPDSTVISLHWKPIRLARWNFAEVE